jgi:hypothetical protein
VSVESGPHLNQAGATVSGTSYYASPGVIPPHSFRYLRVAWTSDACMGADGGTIIDHIILRVRVGLITRTENIPLNEAFELAGTGHSTCP